MEPQYQAWEARVILGRRYFGRNNLSCAFSAEVKIRFDILSCIMTDDLKSSPRCLTVSSNSFLFEFVRPLSDWQNLIEQNPINRLLLSFAINMVIMYIMDIEPNSQESRSSRMHSERRSSYFSLDRTSSHRLSVSNRLSIMNAMDLEYYRPPEDRESFDNPKRTSEFFDRSEDEKHPPIKRQEKSNLTRKSNFRINHECICQSYKNDCAGWHCNCFLSPKEICVVGQCCKGCIESKNFYLQNVCGYTLARDKVPHSKPDDSFQRLLREKKSSNIHYLKQVHLKGGGGQVTCCTCKKSHCQKKYCLCFESGKLCQEYCECEECENKEARGSQNKSEKERKWERYGTFNLVEGVKLDNDFIDQFIQLDSLHGRIHPEMEFEPVNFEDVISNMYM